MMDIITCLAEIMRLTLTPVSERDDDWRDDLSEYVDAATEWRSRGGFWPPYGDLAISEASDNL